MMIGERRGVRRRWKGYQGGALMPAPPAEQPDPSLGWVQTR